MNNHLIVLLGHGENTDLRCCPEKAKDLDISNAITIDKLPYIKPTILADLIKDILPFDDNSVDIIIDTGGVASEIWYSKHHFWTEIIRIMKPNSLYYGKTISFKRISKLSKYLELFYKDDKTFILNKKEIKLVNTVFIGNHTTYQHPALEIMQSFTIHIKALQNSRFVHVTDAWFHQVKYDFFIVKKELEKYPEHEVTDETTDETIYNWKIELNISLNNHIIIVNEDKRGATYIYNNSVATLQIQDISCVFGVDDILKNTPMENCSQKKYNFIYNKKDDKYLLDNILQKKDDNIVITIQRALTTPEDILEYVDK